MDRENETLKNSSILIVDDNEDSNNIIQHYLKSEGYRIKLATSGPGALRLVARETPDLILMDIQMPGMDGFKTSKTIQLNPKFRNVIIIFLTASDKPEDIVAGFASGGADYITKPVTKEELLARVNSHLRLRRQTIELRLFHTLLKPMVPPVVVKQGEILAQSNKTSFPNELHDKTIFFGDIAGFTHLVEPMSPLDALSILNMALRIPTNSIEKNGGYIDKFLGDGLMAVFDDPLGAVIAGVEIQYLFYELNRMRKLSAQESILFRIGINSGEVVMGNVGRKERREWTAVGDVVNTASRIEKTCDPGGLLINSTTYERVQKNVGIKTSRLLNARGKKKALNVFDIESVRFVREGQDMKLCIPTRENEVYQDFRSGITT